MGKGQKTSGNLALEQNHVIVIEAAQKWEMNSPCVSSQLF